MQSEHHVKVTASELSQLWAAYQNDTLARCVLQYFSEKVEDPDIRSVIEFGLEISQSSIEKLTSIFIGEDYPVPQGFTDRDVNVSAPRLFSDSYVLMYVQQMGELGMNAHSVSVALSTRDDIYSFFSDGLAQFNELHRRAKNTLLSKGLYIRSPYLPTPNQANFVTKQNFLTGWLGGRRPLVALEVTNLFDNIQRNAIGSATLIGFGQVAQSNKVKQFMIRGKEIADKHVEILSSVLRENDLPVPMSSGLEVTDSTQSPFSDKLMMFHITELIAIGMGYYGVSLSTTMRRDLSGHYSRLISEVAKYSEDGANIMIENGWMEEPPQAADRDALMHK